MFEFMIYNKINVSLTVTRKWCMTFAQQLLLTDETGKMKVRFVEILDWCALGLPTGGLRSDKLRLTVSTAVVRLIFIFNGEYPISRDTFSKMWTRRRKELATLAFSALCARVPDNGNARNVHRGRPRGCTSNTSFFGATGLCICSQMSINALLCVPKA